MSRGVAWLGRLNDDGRAHGAYHRVQGAPLILKLAPASAALGGGVMGRDRLSYLFAGRRDIEDLGEPLI